MITSQPNFFAAVIAMSVTLLAMPLFIKFVRSRGWGQKIREEGPKDHQSKAGTPTMGGSVFVLASFLATWLTARPCMELSMIWLVILGGFGIGLLDDLTSLMKGRNLGLKARQKLVLQGALGLAPAAYLVWGRGIDRINLPFGYSIQSSLLVLAIGVLVVVATTNSVNLADGMDGLAAGAAIPTLLFFAGVGAMQ